MSAVDPRGGHGLSAADDDLHELGDRWWATETVWFAFHHLERGLGGWLYALLRPNIGTCAGGVWIWDATAWSPFEVPYCANASAQRLPAARDLRAMTLPVGWSVRVLEPLQRYALHAEDGDRLRLDLEFDAVMAPAILRGAPPYDHAAHFDQLGRVTGTIELHGEHLAIDCLSARDRSWGPRPEHRPRRLSYDFGVAARGHGFLCTTDPDHPDGDVVTHGFLLRDGEVAPLARGRRRVERDPATGTVAREVITGQDRRGRTFTATGETVSRIAVNRHTAVTWTSLVRWDLDGEAAAGEDQDLWPVHDWSAFRRAMT